MKCFALVICLAFFLLIMTAIPSAASPVISSIFPLAAPNSGDVTITIYGSGYNANSTVWLDSPYTGNRVQGSIISWTATAIAASFPLKGVTPAKYNVWVNSPFDDAWGHHYDQDVGEIPLGFEIYQGTVTTVTTATLTTATPTMIPAKGSISVSSNPPDADIFLDNEYKGLTPLTIKNVENGYHVVKVRLAGYKDWEKSVVVYGDSPTLYARLVQSTPSITATAPTPSPTTDATPRKTVSPLGIELGIAPLLGAALFLIRRK